MRLRIDLSYDGTDFCGWARQPNLRSVQGVLEETLATVLRTDAPPRTVCAGRTDAGVHARGQVVHVDIDDARWSGDANVVRRLNGLLPRDARVSAVAIAAEGFDARFSALRRHYRYYLTDRVIDPLLRSWVVEHPRELDVAAMQTASATLVGEHDFSAFCREREGASSVRTIQRLEWERTSDGLVVGYLTADAFCHSMVRSIVGALLPVGDGRRPTDWPGQLLAAGERDPAVTVAPPHGLVLEAVDYPDDDELAAQAQAARRWRGDPDDNPNAPS